MLDIIGDIHGTFTELITLIEKLGYVLCKDNLYRHPEGRKPVFVGDLISRGFDSLAVLFLVRDMIRNNLCLSVIGNHEDKVLRWAKGNKVILKNGDENTAWEINNSNTITKEEIVDFFSSLPYFLLLDGGKLIVSHASYKPLQGVADNFDKKYRTWSLYGPCERENLPDGRPNRIDWAAQRIANESSQIIICGHQPFHEVRITNKVYQIDTGCVFGGKLTAVKYPSMEIVQVPAQKKYATNVGWE